MTTEFRPLEFDEMEEAARVIRSSFHERLPWLAGLHTPDEDMWFFREIVFKQNRVWGALRGGGIVGVVAFTSDRINQLYILPEVQAQGIGSKLLAIAQSEASHLRLWTFQANVLARRFYEARGFVAIERTDGSENEEREPAVLYSWSKSNAPHSSQRRGPA